MRDGSQSLWALRMTTGMMESVAQDLDNAGFQAVEVPANPIYFKKFIRDHREDPWQMLRLMAKLMPKTPKACMTAAFIHPFDLLPPKSIVKLFYERVAATGGLQRAQVIANTMNQRTRDFHWYIPFLKSIGVETAAALAYQISPRHTDDYYGQLTREVAEHAPAAIYLKDAGGLLTSERLRTLLPVIVANAGQIPVELHSHCTTGMAPLFYLEAARLGIATLHTALPPLADGSGQPSIFNIARNLRLQGVDAAIDDASLRAASDHLHEIARSEGLPIGRPVDYDHRQFIHQVPGGVISNLRVQLNELRIQDRLDEVLDETVIVQRELGYPMMITPYSQFVVTQAAMNIALGERYKVITDEIIRFTLGAFGTDSGYQDMDQNLRDKVLSKRRANEVQAALDRALSGDEPTLSEIRAEMGAESLSDDDFLLHYLMKGGQDVIAMQGANGYKKFLRSGVGGTGLGLGSLLDELLKDRSTPYISISKGDSCITLSQ